MRTTRVESRDSGHTWLWLVAGAVVALGVGVLVAERTSGRRVSLRTLVARGRGLASSLAENIGPLLETAHALKEAWAEAPNTADEASLADEELDDELEAEDDDERDEDLDEDLDEDEDTLDAPDRDALDARVLEAFAHDPILAERAVEIEAIDQGDIVLHGRVRSAREVTHAVTIARGVPGVTRVREQLRVPRRA